MNNNYILNDNPKTYWIILRQKLENYLDESDRLVYFNQLLKSEYQPYHLYKTRKWARKTAREKELDNSFIYRVIVPVGGKYLQLTEKDIYSRDIIIKNNNKYIP